MKIDIKSILVPVDESEPAQHAFDYAMTVAEALKAKVTLLYIVDPAIISADNYYIDYGQVAADVESYKKSADEYLDSLIDAAPKDVSISKVISVGSPSREVYRYADKEHIDLVIMGNSGKGAISSLVMGSVSASTIKHAKCPVLIIK